MGNRIRTFGLLLSMTLLLLGIGYLVGLLTGISTTYTMGFALIFSVGLNFYTYWKSHDLVLKMHDAEIVSESEAPDLHRLVERLAMSAELPKPDVAIVENDKPNAFATGRNPENAVIAVTKGLLQNMTQEEIEGVVSHELAHIQNRDMLVNTMAAIMAGTITYLSLAGRMSFLFGGGRRGGGGILALVGIILLPIAAMMVRMSVSRTREYGADEEGAKISGHPGYLADGLEKIKEITERKKKSEKSQSFRSRSGRTSRSRRKKSNSNENPATSHMYIYNSVSGSSITKLFSTHPPTEERVEKLREMERTSNFMDN